MAQINIRMNERAEQNADILGKLTVLGTIFLPMTIVPSLWGMNGMLNIDEPIPLGPSKT